MVQAVEGGPDRGRPEVLLVIANEPFSAAYRTPDRNSSSSIFR
jgi:hypothetical protein